MHQAHPTPGGSISPLAHENLPFKASATSGQLGWVGLAAARFSDVPDSAVDLPPLTHHTLIVFIRPPTGLELQYEGVRRHSPPPAGWVCAVPAGTPVLWRWRGTKDSLHVHLEPALVSRVAAEVFEIDDARIPVSSLDGIDLPQLRAALLAVGDELATDAGGRLAAESLSHLLAVYLIRAVAAERRPPAREFDGPLPRTKLRAAVEYVEEHLDSSLTLSRIAAAAHLSPYHFARQFKAATGLPPHRYIVARRIERAQTLLRADGLPLAEVAAIVGFSDQSQFTRHFRLAVGVTPGRFRKSARNA
jgi:AraC family transcriptional regulator